MKLRDTRIGRKFWAGLLLIVTVTCGAFANGDRKPEPSWQHCPEAEAIRGVFSLAPDVWLATREFDNAIAARFAIRDLAAVEQQLKKQLDAFPVRYTLTYRLGGKSLSLKFFYETPAERVILDIDFQRSPEKQQMIVSSGFSFGRSNKAGQDAGSTPPSTKP